MSDVLPLEEVAAHYDRALSCVWHIENNSDAAMVARCVEHLEHIVVQPWWGGYDLTPLHAAIKKGKG